MIQELLKARDYKNFCAAYLSLDKNKTYIDFNDEDETAIDFALFVLNIQREDFNVEIINYLLRCNYDVVDFFDTIKDTPCHTGDNPIKGVLTEIINSKNLHLLDYLNNNHIDSLKGIKNTAFVVSVFLKEIFQEGLEYYACHPEFPYYIISESQRLLRSEIEPNWEIVEKLLHLKNVEIFKEVVKGSTVKELFDWESLKKDMGPVKAKSMMAYMPMFEPSRILSGISPGIMPVKSGITISNSHKKYNMEKYEYHEYHEINSDIKSLWLNYNLQCDLKEKASRVNIKI